MSGGRGPARRESRLSVCMIVKNEEERLPGALASVRSVADEIVVVDTGSADRTVAIAREGGAKVIERPWPGDFSAARNEALDAATGDWILSLDADERLAPGQERALRRLLEGDADAWFVRIRSPLADGRTYEHRFPRLFRNRPAHRFRGRVHEQIIPSLIESGARVRRGEIRIDHEGYAVDRRFAAEKLERNLRLLLEDREERPEDGLVLFHLAETYALLDEPGKAMESYRLALGSRDLPADQRRAARLGLATASLSAGRTEAAAAEAEGLLRDDRDAFPAHLVLASVHLRKGEFERAVAAVDRYLGRAEGPPGKRDGLIRQERDPGRARLIRGEALLRLGRLEDAAREGGAAARAMASSGAPHRLLGRVALAGSRVEEARNQYRKAAEREPERSDAWRDLALASLAAGDREGAAAAVEEGLRRGATESLHQCLGYIRIGAGDLEGAIESYERALEKNPRSGESLRKLAGLYRKTGRNDEASNALTRWRAIEEKGEGTGQKPDVGPAKKMPRETKVPAATRD